VDTALKIKKIKCVTFVSVQAVQGVDFPAVTLCNPNGHDTGEYVRAIFNNFQFLEKHDKTTKSARAKKMFDFFLRTVQYGFQSNLFDWAK
jgi:hypothetical protein